MISLQNKSLSQDPRPPRDDIANSLVFAHTSQNSGVAGAMELLGRDNEVRRGGTCSTLLPHEFKLSDNRNRLALIERLKCEARLRSVGVELKD